jgi:hypothetical protein
MGNWPAGKLAASKPENATRWESLNGRRTTNAQVKNAEPGLRDNFFFLQQADCFKNRPGMIATGCGRGAMGHHADGAGVGVGLVGVVVSRLRDRCPQHQGQTKPRQPSASKPHAFLHWARFSLAYNGCLAQGNAGQVTMGKGVLQQRRRKLLHSEEIMSEPTYEELKAKLSQLEKDVDTKKRSGEMTFKVGEKGGVSVYGLGRFPVTLYYEQWNRLLGAAEDIKKFLEENKSRLKLKEQG